MDYYDDQYDESETGEVADLGDDMLSIISYAVLRQAHYELVQHCPVLSGNMRAHIRKREGSAKNWQASITISGPSYEMNYWKATGEIMPRHHEEETKSGKTKMVRDFDYAFWVNKYGAFGSSHLNSLPSKGWVDRALLIAVSRIAREYGCEVLFEL